MRAPRAAVLAVLLHGLALWPSSPVLAADANGYTAEYECRAGGPHCDVDVAGLGNRPCNQIVDAATPWSAINWSNDTICIGPGDHTAKGDLRIPPTANGTPSGYKVLRYSRPGDSNDDPWRQASADQAKLRRLVIEGDYWLVHRLAFPNVGSIPDRVEFFATAANDVRDVIVNRVLVEGGGEGTIAYGISTQGDQGSKDYQGLSIQNSVLRNIGPVGPPHEAIAVSLHVAPNDLDPNGEHRNSRYYIVNNEIYDWVSHPIQIGRNEGPIIPGIVVENNDLYVTQALYTGDGRSKTESVLSTKVKGDAAHPVRVLHNRMWGTRPADLNFCCNGDGGQAVGQYAPNAFTLYQDNIIFDSQVGFDNVPNDNSIVGNLLYRIAPYWPPYASYAWRTWWNQADGIGDRYETYLNTVVRASGHSIHLNRGDGIDVRCNVFIDSGDSTSESDVGPQTKADYNVFYGTPKVTLNATDTNIDVALRDRAGATPYNVGDILRTGSAESCVGEGDAACFLYKVTRAGTSASGAAAYCTSLGCTGADGTLTVQAVRGPYCFFTKLRTGQERMCIPYAAVHESAPDRGFCATADVGARAGIGINNDAAGSGIFARDARGARRAGTPGALEAAARDVAGVVYVSDLPYIATNGWGPVEKDRSNGEQAAGDGRAITLNGVAYAKGLGAHAVSEVRVPLGGNYSRFISDIGIDDEMDGTAGTAQFEVWADGALLYQSPDMNTTSPTITLNVDVSGKQELLLRVAEGSPSCCDHADWASARLLANVVYVSDLPDIVATNGYGPLERDRSNGEDAAGDGRTITLNGVAYAKGLGAHAVSEVRVPLGGNYSRFISDIGIDDEMDGTAGTAQFEVWADGVRLYQSPDMNTASPTITVNVDVTGKQELVLKVLEGSVGCCDHADWAGARLQM